MTADTYSTDGVGFLIMGVGNDNNTWGGNASSNVFQPLADAVTNALTNTVTGGTLDLSGSPPPAASSQVRYAALIFNGALGSVQTIKVPNLTKWWMVQNATNGAFALQIKTPSGSAVTIPSGSGWQQVYCDGNNNIVVSPFNSTQVLMPNGAVGAPAYAFVNEFSSGWYRAGTQDVRLAINGVDVLQVTGAGASSPSVVNIPSPNSLQFAGVGVGYFTTGDVKLTFKTVADSGWVLMNDSTIGDASSNASYANAAASALFILLYNNIADADAPILTSGGGATTRGAQGSAATAFANHCRLTLPLVLGRSLAGAGAGAGLTSRALGHAVGEEKHTLLLTEAPRGQYTFNDATHSHPLRPASDTTRKVSTADGSHTAAQAAGNTIFDPNGIVLLNSLSTDTASTGASITDNTGSGGVTQGHNVMQPTTFLNVMIKL